MNFMESVENYLEATGVNHSSYVAINNFIESKKNEIGTSAYVWAKQQVENWVINSNK